MQDLRHAFRLWRRAPAVTAIAVLSTALSVGAVAAVYTAVRAVLLDPLPYAQPGRLVQLRSESENAGNSIGDWILWNDAEEIMRRTRTLASAAVYGNAVLNLSGDAMAPPEALYGLQITADTLPALGVAPILGRGILSGEETAHELILSYGLWMRRFHGDRAIAGRTIPIDGHDWAVIGVMGPDFNFPLRRAAAHTPYPYVEFWAPLKRGRQGGLGMVARLQPGVTIEEARQDLASISAALQREFPAAYRDRVLRLGLLRDRTTGSAGRALWLLMAASGLFLLIGCANVANLLLARGLGRQREIAVRMALGAGAGRIARQLLTEGCVLAVAGGALGFAVALAAWRILPALAPANIPRLATARPDTGVLAFAIAVAFANGLLFGLAPALRASRAGHFGTRGAATGRRDWLRGGLVAAEVAITVTLVVTGGRLLASFLDLASTDPGFNAGHVLAAVVLPPPERYSDPAARALVYRRFLDAVRALPGVESAGTVDALPFSGENHGGFLAAGDRRLTGEIDVIGGEYLQTMGARLEAGRWLRDGDSDDAVLVNETAARRLWPGADAVGQRVCLGCTPEDPEHWKIVAGVVTDMRHWSLEGQGEPAVYLTTDAMRAGQFLVLRTRGPADDYQQPLRRAIASVDPQQPVLLSVSMRTLVGDSLAARRFLMLLLAATGLLALVMAAAGVYGVTAYTTSRRRAEIGIRMALGATPAAVHGLVFRQEMGTVAAGFAIGLAAIAAAEKPLRAWLPGLETSGSASIWIAGAAVAASAALACWIPARRAMRVEPVEALRAE
jgi:predicted permease